MALDAFDGGVWVVVFEERSMQERSMQETDWRAEPSGGISSFQRVKSDQETESMLA